MAEPKDFNLPKPDMKKAKNYFKKAAGLSLEVQKQNIEKVAPIIRKQFGQPPRPGLAPQSGDPMHPIRWIRPKRPHGLEGYKPGPNAEFDFPRGANRWLKEHGVRDPENYAAFGNDDEGNIILANEETGEEMLYSPSRKTFSKPHPEGTFLKNQQDNFSDVIKKAHSADCDCENCNRWGGIHPRISPDLTKPASGDLMEKQYEDQWKFKGGENKPQGPKQPPFPGAVFDTTTHRWTKPEQASYLDTAQNKVVSPNINKAMNYIAKQMNMGAAQAKQRGLVPQSGDWEHPVRWVLPDNLEETAKKWENQKRAERQNRIAEQRLAHQKRYPGRQPPTNEEREWADRVAGEHDYVRKQNNPFAIATAAAKKQGYKDFSEGSPGQKKRSEIAEGVKKQNPPKVGEVATAKQADKATEEWRHNRPVKKGSNPENEYPNESENTVYKAARYVRGGKQRINKELKSITGPYKHMIRKV